MPPWRRKYWSTGQNKKGIPQTKTGKGFSLSAKKNAFRTVTLVTFVVIQFWSDKGDLEKKTREYMYVQEYLQNSEQYVSEYCVYVHVYLCRWQNSMFEYNHLLD
jgi:hypothetical protein